MVLFCLGGVTLAVLELAWQQVAPLDLHDIGMLTAR